MQFLNSRIRGKYFIMICLLHFYLQQYSNAQNKNFVFTHLTEENGLLSNQVNTLCQDSRGYMWIGTDNGLQRYDGRRFVNYLANLHDPLALHQSWIKTIFEDSKHRLWVGSGAPYILNNNTGTFYNYNLHRLPGTPLVNEVRNFAEDKNGDIWIISKDSYYKLNNNTDQFEDQGNLAGLNEKTRPGFLSSDSKGNIWFVTTKGISYYDPVRKKYFDKKNNPEALAILDVQENVFSFCIDKENIWLGYNLSRVLYQYNFSANVIMAHPINDIESGESLSKNIDSKVESILSSGEKKILFILPGEGIGLYHPAENSVEEILVNNSDAYGLHSNLSAFNAIVTYEDREKNIWIGGDRGLNIFSPQKKQFRFYGSGNGEANNTLPAFTVNGMLQDRISGDIFIAYYFNTAGIIRLTKDLQFKKQYLYRKNGKSDLQENQVWCLFQDDDGIIWAPNQAKTILKLDPRSNELSLVTDSILSDNISAIQNDKDHNTWMCTWRNGLRKISAKTKAVTNFITPPGSSAFVPRNVFTLFMDNDSSYWVGTNGSGLLQFDPRKGQYIKQYLFDENKTTSISSNVIYKIVAWNNDTLMLATTTGINFFNKRTETFSHLSAKDGLPGDVVTNLEIDGNKNVWVGCYGGLCKMNLNPMRLTRYGLSDGVICNSIERAPFLKMDNGQFLIPTLKGFFAFSPFEITTTLPPPSPVITGFKVFEKNIPVDSLISNHLPVSLSYRENSITIEYASLQFNDPDKLKYYYKLEGVDKDWIPGSDEQAVHYHQLDNKQYTFKVRSENRDGIMSESSIPLLINIAPPFWKSRWFRLVLIILGAGVIIYFYYRRRQAEKDKIRAKEKEMELMRLNKDLATSQLTALRMQMNPHFIFNALNSVQQYILQGNITEANKYLSKFSKLQREILNCSNQAFISLEKEIGILDSYLQLEQLRFGASFTYAIDITNEIDPTEIKIPPMLLQPFVENAIWHGLMPRTGGRALTIGFEFFTDDILLVKIRDNGIGRKASALLKQNNGSNATDHESKGMSMVNQRLHLLELQYDKPFEVAVSDITDAEHMVQGTEVVLKIFIGDKRS